MAITILDRPQGCKLSSTANISYSISSDGYGTAILTGGSGFSDGDMIYLYNTFTSYAGFWVLSSFGPDAFKLHQYSGSDALAYTQSQSSVEVFECLADIDYSCVHLPIVYTLSNNKWPTNTADAIRSIVGFANDNGNIRITLSGAIDVDVLDTLDIQHTSEVDLDGPFTVLTKYSDTQYTIDAPYSLAQGSAYTYSSATAQRYYNNYRANVRIYAGLPATHEWADLKPYALIAELSIPPDADNLIKVNVAEILKEKIGILFNRPNYDSMPFDLDRFCEFYISYAEQYDESNGTDVETFTGSYQSDFDFFQGVAVDAELPFKNRYSGFLSDYMYGDASNLAKFLSDIEIPMIFPGYYFDISYINEFSPIAFMRSRLYDEFGNLTSTEYFPASVDRGILRQSLTASGNGYLLVDLLGSSVILAANLWDSLADSVTTTATTWSKTSAVSMQISQSQPAIIPDGSFIESFSFKVNMADSRNVDIQISLDNGQPLYTSSAMFVGDYIVNFGGATTIGDATTLTIDVSISSGATTTVTIDISNAIGAPLGVDISTVVSEEKRIDVYHDCPQQYLYITWKNYLGGFNYWLFTAVKDYGVNVIDTQQRQNNIYSQWPRSFGEHNDTINQETYRSSVSTIVVRAENLSKEQVEFLKGIRISSLVQQMTSKYDRRTMIVDADSFKVRTDGEGISSIEFTLQNTANNPSQSL